MNVDSKGTETNRLNTADTVAIPRHDISEVNEYLMSGLVVSPIDKWFVGPVPQFSLDSIVPATPTMNLRSSIDRARAFAADPANLTWPPVSKLQSLFFAARYTPSKALEELIPGSCCFLDNTEERSVAFRSKSRCAGPRVGGEVSEVI